MDQKRVARIAQEVKKSLSHGIAFELNDPKIAAMTSITDVIVSNDLSYADVYVTILGTSWEKRQTLEGLESASGFLKRLLGREIKLRSMPELRFKLDDSIEHGLYMDRLIEQTIAQDEENARARGEEHSAEGGGQ